MQKEKNTSKKSTTIAINIADSTLVEDYCKKYEILKKDFVGLAVRWFMDNDIDIRSEVSFAPVQEHQEQQQGAEVAALCKLMAEFITTSQQQQLPDNSREQDIANREKDITWLQNRLDESDKERQILQRRLNLALSELRHCKGLFATADERVLKELGII